ncbi:sensor histidine kinase [Nocardioides insulae]|uniref:sensor histidine kinase n=1 Tax=Nocardioides insulae TaxID=394734 RepID=UPI0004161895|nr:histidine kinase [Nocardioides insulae]
MEVRRQPWQLDERGRRWFDVALASVLLVPVLAMPALGWVAALFSLVEVIPLYWRRRHPVAVFAVIAGASALQATVVTVPVWGQVAFPIAVYSVARFATTAAGLAALTVGLVGALVASVTWLSALAALSGEGVASYTVTIGTIVLAAWALGTLARTRQAYIASLEARHEQQLRSAEQRVALAAADERARIAREMHDVVAHGLSVVIVQADGGRYAAGTDPDAAQRALTTIAATGREALREMRRLLGVLRDTDAGVSPQPSLADLGHLVEEARQAGTPVSADLPDPDELARQSTGPVPGGAGLASYRIVQEALNNIRRHAGPGARAWVRVVVHPDSVEVDVVDDGRGAAAASEEHGLGLIGMRERVDARGGRLDVGPLPGGGFRVWARMPL